MLVVVANSKGGVGKSTLATNLAVMFALRKYRALVYDADMQRSSWKWCSLRSELGNRPAIDSHTRTDDIYDDLAAVSKAADVTIVDAGGRRGPELVLALGQADVLVLPVSPSQFDVWALDDIASVVEKVRAAGAGFRSYAVLNNVSSHPQSRDVRATRAALTAYDSYFTPCVQAIVGRQVFRDALVGGLSAVEAEAAEPPAKRRATEELNAVFKEIFE